MKRYWRILKIAVAGKYQYMKRVHKWRMGRLFRDLQELTPYYFETFNHKYGDQNFLLAAEALGNESPYKNFGMIVPQEAFEQPKMVEDPNGAPIYRGCDAGLCACTGRCMEIVGYSQDPEDIRKYRERIERYNQPQKPFNYGTLSEQVTKDGITTRTWTIDKKPEL